jgi:hypothetical protein
MTGFKSKREMAQEDDDIQDYVRPWVGLTDEEVDAAWGTVAWHSSKGLFELSREYAQAIEQALKEKNNG